MGYPLCSEHVVKSGLRLNLRRFALAHAEEFDEIYQTLRSVPFLMTPKDANLASVLPSFAFAFHLCL